MSDNSRLKEIFNKALELPVEERAAFLKDATGDDRALLREVEDLLSYHLEDTFLEIEQTELLEKKNKEEKEDPTEVLFTDFQSAKSKVVSISNFKFFLVVPLLILIIAGGWTYRSVRLELLESREKDLKNTMESNILTMKIWIGDQQHFCQLLASVPRVREKISYLTKTYGYGKDGNRDSIWQDQEHIELVALLNPVLNQFGYPGFSVLDRTGFRVATDSYKQLSGRVNATGVKEFGPAMFEGKPKFTRPYLQEDYSLDTSKVAFSVPLTWVDSPVFDEDSQIVATIGVCQFADEGFSKILNLQRLGESGETFAFDEKGLLVSHTIYTHLMREAGLIKEKELAILNTKILDPGYKVSKSKPYPKDYYSRPLTKIVGEALFEHKNNPNKIVSGVIVKPYRNYAGIKTIGSYVWLPEFGFGMITEIPADEALAPLRYLDIIFFVLLALFLFFIVYSWYARFSVRKLKLKIGEVIKLGQYTLQDLIGEGGMGKVYRAKHAVLKRPTAIKILKPEITSPETIRRFKKEVQLASQLTHPNTIAIYDYGVNDDDTFYYAMEFLEGVTLSQAVRLDGKMNVRRVMHILKQICGSISEAHQKGLIHRDIKPLNIMLCERGGIHDFVKVLDFGLVKDINEDNDVTKHAQITGTPIFMAPERFTEPTLVDATSDIYSIGALAYFLLTGIKAFDHPNQMNVLQKVLDEKPTPIEEFVQEGLPNGLAALVLKCMEKEPSNRPESVQEIIYLMEDMDMDPWTEDEAELWWDRQVTGIVF